MKAGTCAAIFGALMLLHCCEAKSAILTPPMGWRSWNLFGANVNQQLMESIMNGMVSRKRTVDGVPTSLCDLGYCNVGLDDNWQLCGSYGPNHNTYHDVDGSPVVNLARFPNMKNMTDYAHSLGLGAGWYGNNCICSDHCNSDACYQGDVAALVAYGFDAVKLDGCGAEYDLTKFNNLIDATGRPITIENCHWGGTIPNATWCPWNFYRSSGDVRANYASIIGNLQTTIPLAAKNLSTPGCWAYPDMLEVGCAAGPGGQSDSGLTLEETRSHFGAWAIVSSPLTLSHDTNNDTISDFIWPIISNKEVITINQAYYGYSGTAFASSDKRVVLTTALLLDQPTNPPTPGKYVVAVNCNASDATQNGWSYNAAQQSVQYNGQCVDASDSSQLVLAACTGAAAQTFTYSASSKYNPLTLKGTSNCIDVWDGSGGPGGPVIQLYNCHSSSNQAFDIATSTISDADGLCFASRAAVPTPSGSTSQYFNKPMAWDGSTQAVLLMNHDVQPSDLTVQFNTIPGLSCTSCKVRDVWQQKDLGTFQSSFTASSVGIHDCAFLMISPA